MPKDGKNFAASYFHESARPLTSLVFLTPMLIAYEGATIFFGPQAMRNGADVWLRELLSRIGFGQYFLLPLLVVGILVGWHHVQRQPWSLRPRILVAMLIESLVFAAALLLLARIQSRAFDLLAASESGPSKTAQLFAFFGAGIYEELLFRLMLMPAIILLLRRFRVENKVSLIWGVVISSLLFSMAHYQLFTGHGDEFAWFSFSFRFLAGAFFCALFLSRGFGIAVGAHAFYDILVVLKVN